MRTGFNAGVTMPALIPVCDHGKFTLARTIEDVARTGIRTKAAGASIEHVRCLSSDDPRPALNGPCGPHEAGNPTADAERTSLDIPLPEPCCAHNETIVTREAFFVKENVAPDTRPRFRNSCLVGIIATVGYSQYDRVSLRAAVRFGAFQACCYLDCITLDGAK